MGRSSRRMWGVAVLGGLVWAAPAAAQQRAAEANEPENRIVAKCSADADAATCVKAEQPAAVPASVAERLVLPPAAGPLLAATRSETREAEAPLAPVFQRNRGPGYALAIAGGALFVAGILAGDDAGAVMMLVGAGVGAYGLYLMLR